MSIGERLFVCAWVLGVLAVAFFQPLRFWETLFVMTVMACVCWLAWRRQ